MDGSIAYLLEEIDRYLLLLIPEKESKSHKEKLEDAVEKLKQALEKKDEKTT